MYVYVGVADENRRTTTRNLIIRMDVVVGRESFYLVLSAHRKLCFLQADNLGVCRANDVA